jgi:hypothetical protein
MLPWIAAIGQVPGKVEIVTQQEELRDVLRGAG